MDGQTSNLRSLRRRMLWAIIAVVPLVAGMLFVMKLRETAPRRTPASDALEYVRTHGGDVALAAIHSQFLNVPLQTRFEATEVSIPIECLTDQMVSHLTNLESLERVVLLGKNFDKAKTPVKASLEKLGTPLSKASLAELQRKLPRVEFCVNPARKLDGAKSP